MLLLLVVIGVGFIAYGYYEKKSLSSAIAPLIKSASIKFEGIFEQDNKTRLEVMQRIDADIKEIEKNIEQLKIMQIENNSPLLNAALDYLYGCKEYLYLEKKNISLIIKYELTLSTISNQNTIAKLENFSQNKLEVRQVGEEIRNIGLQEYALFKKILSARNVLLGYMPLNALIGDSLISKLEHNEQQAIKRINELNTSISQMLKNVDDAMDKMEEIDEKSMLMDFSRCRYF